MLKRVLILSMCFGAALLAVTLAGALVWKTRVAQRTLYTDGQSISMPASQAKPREVMWSPPLALSNSINSEFAEFDPQVSADGLTLLLVRRDAIGDAAVFWSKRDELHGDWPEAQPLIELHSHGEDIAPVMSRDGRAIYFASDRAGGIGGLDLWVSRLADFGWLPPENLGAAVNTTADETSPALTPDGRLLYFASDRSATTEAGEQLVKPWPTAATDQAGLNDLDLYSAQIIGDALQSAMPVQALNSDGHDSAPALSPAGDFLYFSSDRPGGFGRLDLYRARLIDGQPQSPANLGFEINSNENEFDPAISLHGFVLHFASDRAIASASADRTPGDANIFHSVSREVFTQLADGPLFDWAALWSIIGPSVFWLLLALLAIALLLMALATMRGARAERLSLLARCLLASLIFHLALMILMTFWQVTTSIGDMLERHGAMQVAIVSSPHNADELHTQVRGGLTAIELASDAIELKRALAEFHPSIESPHSATNAVLETENLNEEIRDDSLAKLDQPSASDSTLEPPAIEARLAQADASEAPALAPPPEPVPLRADEPVQAVHAMDVDTQRDRSGEQVPSSAASAPPMVSAIAMRPEQSKSLETARGSMAAQRQASETRPTLGATRQVEPEIAASAKPIDINAMPAPRQVESKQPELAMASTKIAEAKANAFAPSSTEAPQAAHVPPLTSARGAQSRTMAAAVNPHDASPARAISQPTSTLDVKPNAVEVAVKTETGSKPVEAREAAVAINARATAAIRAATGNADAPKAHAVAIAPLPTQPTRNVATLTAATPADTASHVEIATSQPMPALDRAVATATDVGTPVEASLAGPANHESQLAVAVGASTSAARASTPTAQSSGGAPRTEVSPEISQPSQQTHNTSLASSATATALRASSPAKIDISSPQAIASPSNAALADLAVPQGTLPRPTAGDEPAPPTTRIATSGTNARAETTPLAVAVSSQSIALNPDAPTRAKTQSPSSLISTDLPHAAPSSRAAAATPLMQPLAGRAASIDVATPATAAAAGAPANQEANETRIAAAETPDIGKTRADVPADTTAPALAAIDLTPTRSESSHPPSSSMAATLAPSFNDVVALTGEGSPSVVNAPVAIHEIESVALAVPPGNVDAAIAAETIELAPNRIESSIAQRSDIGKVANTPATPAAVQVAPILDAQSPRASSLLVILPSMPAVETAPRSIEPAPPPPPPQHLAMSAPAGFDIKTPQDAAPIAENPYPQRAEEKRKELVKRGGGSEATEKAVALALEWLSRHQSADGRWAARDFDKTCGECDGRGKFDTDVATTGLALLCFLGADHTHMKDGKYRDQIQRALDWILTQQLEDGDWRGGETMYSHGIATIAVCEAYAMTGDLKLKPAVKNAIDYIWLARNRNIGGWRYEPGQVGDTSVLGWQIMALMSAKRAGFFVPAEAFEMARNWLDLASTPARPGLYAYQPGQRFTTSMTAEGMFIQQLSGRDRNENRMIDSADFLTQNLPVWRSDQNSYFWYYGTLALFQHQGEHWQKWNKSLTAQLLANQQMQGHEAGSWDPVDNWAKIGGRVYQTALCTLCLEVYYRYLPMYAAVEEDQ